jgi:hypothetical protein
MPKPAPTDRLLYIMLRAQLLAKQESSDRGYVMIFVSILTVMIFSLLAAYLMMTNLSRASTNAYVEGNSTFYAAESGLNQRANAMRQKFIDYGVPAGKVPGEVAGRVASVANMAACVDSDTANDGSDDFACQKQDFNYRHGSNFKFTTGADGKSQTATDSTSNVKYTAYTFAADRTVYTDPVLKIPQVTNIPSGQVFAGLNAMEYRYTVFSMATSKQPDDLDARAMTVLEMTFKNRAIPLFQFAAFYDGDLEMTSTSQMDITGPIHTNGNFYAQPTPDGTPDNTRLLGNVTVTGKIYNRADSFPIDRHGVTKVFITGDASNPDATGNVYEDFPAYAKSREYPLTLPEINKFKGRVLDGDTGATKLTLPPAGFLRKKDKYNNIGDYYGRADLRLEMAPKRAVGTVPFNFKAIQDGGSGGSCAGFDLPSTRQGSNLKCTKLNEGQLRSLQQPIMVRVVSNEERASFCPASVTTNYDASIDLNKKTLRALQVAIAAQNKTVPLSQLQLALSNGQNSSIKSIANGLLTANSLATLDDTKTPEQIANAMGACFHAAPIQVLKSNDAATSRFNWTSSYYDRREKRWIGILQTNIASLTLWNRDGVYVDRDNDLTTNDSPIAAKITTAFNDSATYDTNNLLFLRATANPAAPIGSFRKLGLGAADITEGGLVFHATLSDDLGDGTTISIDPADNLRNYADGKTKGSYGFAFNDGNDLPGDLTVASDLPIYVQGDYNNFISQTDRQSASILGDVITVLSKSCVDSDRLIDCGIPSGQKPATTTTINAAFLSRTDQSNGNIGSPGFGKVQDTSGGLNNYMRMVENWKDQTFKYKGSFVSLGIPQEFSGAYVFGGSDPDANYYYIPDRNFSYDTNFNAFTLLPPLTPRVIYLQQETFKRSYN